MKSAPPPHLSLPVLTERVEPVPPAVVPAEAPAAAVGDHTMPGQTAAPAAGGAAEAELQAVWQRIAPALQEQVGDAVQAELLAQAPQLAARVFAALEPALRRAVAQALTAR